MRRTFDDLERAVHKLLAKGDSRSPIEGAGGSESDGTAAAARRLSGAQREAAELVKRAIKRLKAT